ncbi:hypothetical protein [Rhodoferax lacus]|nr:hypothetical protein [Rhodoferax lacus]
MGSFKTVPQAFGNHKLSCTCEITLTLRPGDCKLSNASMAMRRDTRRLTIESSLTGREAGIIGAIALGADNTLSTQGLRGFRSGE